MALQGLAGNPFSRYIIEGAGKSPSLFSAVTFHRALLHIILKGLQLNNTILINFILHKRTEF